MFELDENGHENNLILQPVSVGSVHKEQYSPGKLHYACGQSQYLPRNVIVARSF